MNFQSDMAAEPSSFALFADCRYAARTVRNLINLEDKEYGD